ncbi:MAG: PPOX class F420-dependent oxidoreductase, partial [Chloroflexia bacterium]|nr:PPOX class F420-dependent oxidoreductase [Chloroflexia bacterium]
MPALNASEARAFLLSSPRTAALATVRADGRPHVAPVWFDLDGDDVLFTTGKSTVKGENIQRDPRVSLCVDDESPPFAFVLIEGVATWTENHDELLNWATQIAGRYMGAEQAAPFGRRNA